MIQKEMNIVSSTGSKLFAKTWQPDGDINAVVVLVHGFGEHCSRYTPYFDLFEKFNIAFLGYDLYGHGQSDGNRGTINSYASLLDDVNLLIEKAGILFPNSPKFLYGHSMGGNIAFNYMLSRSSNLMGGIISSPWLVLHDEPNNVLKKAVTVLKNIVPNLTVNSGLDTKYISTINEEVKLYDADPLNHGRISFRLVDAITKQGLWAIENAKNIKLPTLIMHGTADKITSSLASALAAKGNEALVDYKEWKGMYHEVHNDTAREQLANFVGEWILNIIK